MEDNRLCENQFTIKYFQNNKDRFQPTVVPFTNDTELEDFRGVFSKGFPHPNMKDPSGPAYSQFVNALKNRNWSDIQNINNTYKKIVDSYCITDYELVGMYKSCFSIEQSPSPISEKAAAELIEVYNMAVARDVNILDWDSSPVIANVLTSLNLVKNNLDGPMENGNITANTLFRGPTPGDLAGPYVSQFLYYPITLGAFTLTQKYISPEVGKDYLRDINQFIDIWNGGSTGTVTPGPKRYLMSIRDCTSYIHADQMWQPFYMAATILQNMGVSLSNPVVNRTGSKFINLGPIDLFSTMVEAAKLAMNATWCYKYNQLRLRPEEMAYQVHLKKTEDTGLNFPESLLSNPVLNTIYNIDGKTNYLMPQAYPEGAPAHPSFPSGHATLAGSMTTIMKAFFKTDSKKIRALVPTSDGSDLVNYLVNGQPVDLDINDELDKLASNCAIFRNFAGIHYRTDAEDGILLGEKVAIQLLEEYVKRYTTSVKFTLKKRDGTVIEIKNF